MIPVIVITRKILYGYKVSDSIIHLTLKKLPEVKPELRIWLTKRRERLMNRTPVSVKAGITVMHYAPPIPDTQSTINIITGIFKRFGMKLPDIDYELIEELREFTIRLIEKKKNYLMPIDPDADVTVETWLKSTHYTEVQKKDLLNWVYKIPELYEWNERDAIYFMLGMFIKYEYYIDIKFARLINAPHDAIKVLSGPFFKLIEEKVFAMPAFIKHVPVKDRPAHIMRRHYVPGATYLETDYTSFEASASEPLMNACEMPLYEYLSSKHPLGPRWFQFVKKYMTGDKVCRNKYVKTKLHATRMSGEMCTSLGNGWTNYVVMKFVAHKLGIKMKISCEGDDGLDTVIGPSARFHNTDLFSRLGLVLKFDEYDNLEDTTFCGLTFDAVSMTPITNPFKVLASFGWIDAKYAGSRFRRLEIMMRVKALSFAYSYPGCPIIQALAWKHLELTRHITSKEIIHDILTNRSYSVYDRDRYKEMFRSIGNIKEEPVTDTARMAVFKHYGLTEILQEDIEKQIHQLADLQAELIIDANVEGFNNWKIVDKLYSFYVNPYDFGYRFPAYVGT